MTSLIIQDNFFRNPLLVRLKGLTYEYYDKILHPDSTAINSFPGVRSLDIYDTDIKLYNYVKNKITKILKKNNISKKINPNKDGFRLHFSLTFENTPYGFHQDIEYDEISISYAGIIYLNIFPKPKCGTIILHNELYEINNIFNRMVIYPCYIFHSLLGSFGNNLFNSRMVMSIFMNLVD
jgi:hypothetical protein